MQSVMEFVCYGIKIAIFKLVGIKFNEGKEAGNENRTYASQ